MTAKTKDLENATREEIIELNPITSKETSKKEVVKKLQRIREEHARNQKKDYSHVFRKKSLLNMIQVTTVATGIELAFAAETAFVSPILLSIGLKHSEMTMVWALPPLLGFFVSPFLGSVSDRCRLSYGRRRPVIILLSILLAIGMVLVPYGHDFGKILGDIPEQGKVQFSVIITIIGIILIDFNADCIQTPARAYALDITIPSQQTRIINTFSTLSGVGGIIGYTFGAIDWMATPFGSIMGDNIPTAFMMIAVVFLLTVIISITSFREIPLPLIEKDELLKPVNESAVVAEMKRLNPDYVETESTKDDDEGEEHMTLVQYLKTIVVMPRSLQILCLTNLFCWMSHLCYNLYFTDFVGEAVFYGDPRPDSSTYSLYEEGVRFGCWGLCIFSFTCSVYSMFSEVLIKLVGLKTVYFTINFIHTLSMLCLAHWPCKWGVLVHSVSAGTLYATIFTVPFLLVAAYHDKECFKIKDGKTVPLASKRGLGTDIAVVGSMVFIGQLIMSLCIGYFINYIGSTSAVIYASSFLSFCACISSLFVLYI
ncbi:hypothetical protein ACFFRR_007219 [Megaselia abdita]